VGVVILAAVTAVLIGLGVQQSRFDPALFTPPEVANERQGAAPPAVASPFQGLAPRGWQEAGPAEFFRPDTLYQKVNGADNLYLSAGFQSLACQRYASMEGARKFQACLYRMGDADGAWSVYSRQRRADAQPLDLGRGANRTSNALFLALGTAYLEVVAPDDAPATASAVEGLARAWVESAGQGPEAAAGPPFPAAGLDAASVHRVRGSPFGFTRLDDVTLADYTLDGAAATAFWSERRSPEEASGLSAAYVEYLLTNGARKSAIDLGVPGAVALDVLGTTEVVVPVGRLLVGVHEADTPAAAVALVRALVSVAPAPVGISP